MKCSCCGAQEASPILRPRHADEEASVAAKSQRGVRRLIPLIVLILAAAGIVIYLQQKRIPREVVLSGTLEARTVNVGSLVGGRVTRVLVDEGNRVTPGQVLAVLETETVDRTIAEQQAAIDAARAELAKAVAGPRSAEIAKVAAVAENDERERRRTDQLRREGIVSRQQYDDAATKARTSAEELRLMRQGTRPEDIAAARAQVEQQQRRLQSLMKQRAETEVKATVAGVVQSFGLRPGDLVAPNQTVAELLESDQLWVRVYVPETMLGLVRINQPAKIKVDTFPKESFDGHVAAISSQGEYTPRNVQTRAQRAEQVFGVKVVVDASPKLKAGMAADVDLGVKGRP
jgi:multidrug resistance efflux pump